jgi:hypothetical protein
MGILKLLGVAILFGLMLPLDAVPCQWTAGAENLPPGCSFAGYGLGAVRKCLRISAALQAAEKLDSEKWRN